MRVPADGAGRGEPRNGLPGITAGTLRAAHVEVTRNAAGGTG
ncbi:hypothetical protein [Streptomyces sp. NBC_01276]